MAGCKSLMAVEKSMPNGHLRKASFVWGTISGGLKNIQKSFECPLIKSASPSFFLLREPGSRKPVPISNHV
jgi:hypothetical protein